MRNSSNQARTNHPKNEESPPPQVQVAGEGRVV